MPAIPAGARRPGRTLVYKPIGGHQPAGNYLVSDSDYVEVLTEIDIQTPIPPEVQALRSGRNFLFLGCRFDDQLTRSFARQIMKALERPPLGGAARRAHPHGGAFPRRTADHPAADVPRGRGCRPGRRGARLIPTPIPFHLSHPLP